MNEATPAVVESDVVPPSAAAGPLASAREMVCAGVVTVLPNASCTITSEGKTCPAVLVPGG
jgi:hypothetical protein